MTENAILRTEEIKGHNSYTVEYLGTEVARAHCVQVQRNLYTLVVDGKWSGIGTEEEIVAKLRSIVNLMNDPA